MSECINKLCKITSFDKYPYSKYKIDTYNFLEFKDILRNLKLNENNVDNQILFRWIKELLEYNNFYLNNKKSDKVKRLINILYKLKLFAGNKKDWNDFYDNFVKDLSENISHINYKDWQNEQKIIYKKNNLLFPNERVSKDLDKYQLKNGLKFNPIESVLKKEYKCNEIIGFDTETYNGYCKLICDNNGRSLYIEQNEFGTDKAFFELLNFLLYHIDNKDTHRFFFNIDFDVQAILKHLNYEKYEKELEYLRKGIPVIFFGKYELFWLRGVSFRIKVLTRKRCVEFTDLYKFYNLGLGKAGQEYLNENKLDKIDSKRLNDDLLYWYKNIKDIEKYCIQDCILTQKLAWNLVNSIKECGLKLPKTLYSPASISKANYRYRNLIPSIRNNVSMKLVQIGFDCYYGGRFELFKRGKFKKSWLFDINSQYPTIIKDLPDMRNGFWQIYKDLKELPKKRVFGYFLCKLKVPYDNYISTLPFKDTIVRFYNGYSYNWFTWFDLDLMRDYIIDIKKAYIFNIHNNNKFPFREKTLELYKKKAEFKKLNKMMYNTVKITLNGIYGCFIEKHESYHLDKDGNIVKEFKGGKLFNPIYASQITSFGRWSVIKDIPKEKWNNIIGIHTDSIITNKDISKYLDIGNKLGQWSLEAEGKGIFLNTGMYQIGKKLFKSRGIPKNQIKNWFKFCRKNKKYESKVYIQKRMVKISEAMIQDKDTCYMNTMRDIERTVNANSDSKRCWIKDFKNFNELRKNNIDSLPLCNFNKEFNEIDLQANPIILSKQTNIDLKYAKFIMKNQDIY